MDEQDKETVLNSFECCLCLELVDEIHYVCSTVGGHRMCITCEKSLKVKTCPICKLFYEIRRDSSVLHIYKLLGAERRCKYHNEGCESKISQKDYDAHIAHCEFKKDYVAPTIPSLDAKQINIVQVNPVEKIYITKEPVKPTTVKEPFKVPGKAYKATVKAAPVKDKPKEEKKILSPYYTFATNPAVRNHFIQLGVAGKDLQKNIKEKWNNMTDAEKQPYINESEANKKSILGSKE